MVYFYHGVLIFAMDFSRNDPIMNGHDTSTTIQQYDQYASHITSKGFEQELLPYFFKALWSDVDSLHVQGHFR